MVRGQLWSVLTRLQALETHLSENGVLRYRQHILVMCPQQLCRAIVGAAKSNCKDYVLAKDLAKHLPTSLVGHYQFPE